MEQNIIEINNLTYDIGDRKLYDNLSLSISKCSFTNIIGPTGSGKTILSQIMIGKVLTDSNIKISGNVLNNNNKNVVRDNILYLDNTCSNILICDLVIDNLFFSIRKSKKEITDIDVYMSKIINEYNLSSLLDRKIKTLSDSEKKYISLICSIIISPKILIIDELIEGIDKLLQQKILKNLKKLVNEDMTIINFTQDSELLLEGTHIALLNNGKIVLCEQTKNAFDNPKIFMDNKIELPFIIDISTKLRYYEVVDKIYFNTEELVESLWK